MKEREGGGEVGHHHLIAVAPSPALTLILNVLHGDLELQNTVTGVGLQVTAMAMRLAHPLTNFFHSPVRTTKPCPRFCKFVTRSQFLERLESNKLVMEVKEKLERDYQSLPVGKQGRDDEDMILWFLKDRKFDVEAAATKLARAIKWRQEFGVSELSEESVKSMLGTGKAYVHDHLDVNDRPVLVVVASKHFPSEEERTENERLCIFLVEKALSKLPDGKQQLLGIFDLRGFSAVNVDFEFLKFLFDVFYNYYPNRLGNILYVDAPLVFMPLWELVKPLLKSYASLVRFCSADAVRKEYFTETTVPVDFRN